MANKVNNAGKNPKTGKSSSKGNAQNKRFIFIGIGLVLIFILGYSFLSNSSKSSASGSSASSSGSEGVKIVKKDITSTAKFYPYETNGIKMEVLAVKAKDGTVRTAFNTCQVCYASGKGYYIQEGDELVCQNCGNRFKTDMVGVSKNGCNPVPILKDNKTEDGSNIVISKEFLDRNKTLFAKWKS